MSELDKILTELEDHNVGRAYPDIVAFGKAEQAITALISTEVAKAKIELIDDLELDAQDCISISGDTISDQFIDIMANTKAELEAEIESNKEGVEV